MFKRLLYVFVLCKCIYWLFYYSWLFGPNSLIYLAPFKNGYWKDFAFVLINYNSPFLSIAFIVGVMLLIISKFLFSRLYIIHDILIWWLILNINNRVYATLNGGDYLLNQLLLFNCLLSGSVSKKNSVVTFLNNTGHVTIITQICIVYLISALTKVSDKDWIWGNALNLINQTEHYRLLNFPHKSTQPSLASTLLNYLIIIYQLLFPLVIWLPRLKKPFLIFGILMHLYITFVMGLMWFGFIMIICYAYFWPLKKAES